MKATLAGSGASSKFVMRIARISLLAIVLLVCGGCGQYGVLYSPGNPKTLPSKKLRAPVAKTTDALGKHKGSNTHKGVVSKL